MARARERTAVARGNRQRGSLSREEILEAGLLIAKRDELTQLTMKKLADELGVTPVAIYRHFKNKAEIVDGVLDLFVCDAAVTEHQASENPEDWQRCLLLTSGRMFSALVETPGVMPFLSTASRFGPAAMAALDSNFPNTVDEAADLARILQRFPFEMELELLIQRELPSS